MSNSVNVNSYDRSFYEKELTNSNYENQMSQAKGGVKKKQSLFVIPKDLFYQHLFPYLSLKDVKALAVTCQDGKKLVTEFELSKRFSKLIEPIKDVLEKIDELKEESRSKKKAILDQCSDQSEVSKIFLKNAPCRLFTKHSFLDSKTRKIWKLFNQILSPLFSERRITSQSLSKYLVRYENTNIQPIENDAIEDGCIKIFGLENKQVLHEQFRKLIRFELAKIQHVDKLGLILDETLVDDFIKILEYYYWDIFWRPYKMDMMERYKEIFESSESYKRVMDVTHDDIFAIAKQNIHRKKALEVKPNWDKTLVIATLAVLFFLVFSQGSNL